MRSTYAMATSVGFEQLKKHNYWTAAPVDTGIRI